MTRSTLLDVVGLIGLVKVGVGFYLYGSLGLALIVVGSIILGISLVAAVWGALGNGTK